MFVLVAEGSTESDDEFDCDNSVVPEGVVERVIVLENDTSFDCDFELVSDRLTDFSFDDDRVRVTLRDIVRLFDVEISNESDTEVVTVDERDEDRC